MSTPLWPEIRAAKEGVFWVPAGTLFTVNGTSVPDPFGPGFSGDVARALIDVSDGMWVWQPIGYPAATFPMGPSVVAGCQELRTQIGRYTGNIALSGYSQGALVVDMVWRDDIVNPAGTLHHRLEDVVAIVNFGDPMRCPGIANGNKFAGRPLPVKLNGFTTGGIAGPGNLTEEQTPDFLLSFANDGDLFACAPTGDDPWQHETEVGHNERIIFDLVQNATPVTLLAIAEEAAEILAKPLSEVLPLVQAIFNGLVFAGQGMQAPHWAYDIGPAVQYLIQRGNELRAPALVNA
jgi:Cutinase